eukprot:374227-Prymnesium_polylepis.1
MGADGDLVQDCDAAPRLLGDAGQYAHGVDAARAGGAAPRRTPAPGAGPSGRRRVGQRGAAAVVAA